MSFMRLTKTKRMELCGAYDLDGLEPYRIRERSGAYSFPICTDILRRVLDQVPQVEIDEDVWREISQQTAKDETSMDMRDEESFSDLAKTLRSEGLYPYQVEAVEWMLFMKRGILADEQGLGKTVMAIKAMQVAGAFPALIVCSEAKCDDWLEHVQRWSSHGSRAKILRGESEQREEILDWWRDNDVLICNYSIALMYCEVLRPKTAIFDEVHKLRNRKSQQFQGAKKITASSKYVFLLTASPVINATSDLWPLLYLCDPKRFASYWGFAYRFCEIVEGRYGLEVRNVKASEEKNLQELTMPYTLSRSGILDLPTPRRRRIRYQMGPEQRRVYREMEDTMTADFEGDSVETSTVLSNITRLRQICIHPGLIFSTYDGESKLDTLAEIVRERSGKVVVFTNFAALASLAEKRLESLGIVARAFTGEMTHKKRAEVLRDFKSGDVQVMIVTHKTGGEGLNLTEADRAVFLDLAWHPAGNKHAARRILRIGQTSDNVEIVVIHAEGSIEDHIEAIIREKGEVVLEELVRRYQESRR